MRVSAISLALSAAVGAAIALMGAPASAKTTAECNREYAANKDAIKASGQTKKAFVAACRSSASMTPAAPAAEPAPTPTSHGY